VRHQGAQAEDLALQFLLSQGLRLRTRNYTCRVGEIDLVMQDGAALVFVEVRSRSSSAYGGAAQSITARKRMRLIAAARHFLSRQRAQPPCRFDAVLIDARQQLEWIRDAFNE
jgi:putative endonuclease